MAVNIGVAEREVRSALVRLDELARAAATAAGISSRLIELVKIRTSQINECAFCLRMHTRMALSLGEAPDRLAVLPAWRESAYFDATERAALALTESVTASHLRVSTDSSADGVLSDAQIAALTWVAIVVGAWNRVAIFSEYHVAPDATER